MHFGNTEYVTKKNKKIKTNRLRNKSTINTFIISICKIVHKSDILILYIIKSTHKYIDLPRKIN